MEKVLSTKDKETKKEEMLWSGSVLQLCIRAPLQPLLQALAPHLQLSHTCAELKAIPV